VEAYDLSKQRSRGSRGEEEAYELRTQKSRRSRGVKEAEK
jgi:hypothetical protein